MAQDFSMKKPLVSLEELDALLGGRSTNLPASVDRYYPLKIYALLLVVLMYIVRTVFFTEETSQSLFPLGDRPNFLVGYLYFRGWFLVVCIVVFLRSYINGRLIALVSASLLAFSVVSLLFDIFSIYSEKLVSPDPLFTIRLLLRVAAIALMFSCMRNAHNVPSGPDKWNPFLPFKRR